MEWLKTAFDFMVNTGTDGILTSLVKNNVLLCALAGVVAYITPWSWDNKLYDKLKEMFSREKK